MINKTINKYVLITTLVLKDTPCHVSIKSFGLYRSPKFVVHFPSKKDIPPWLWKVFKCMEFRLLENAFVNQKVDSRPFYSYPPLHWQSSPSGSYHVPCRGKLYLRPRKHFFVNLFPPTERVEKNICYFNFLENTLLSNVYCKVILVLLGLVVNIFIFI